jgi:hypothetical protein
MPFQLSQDLTTQSDRQFTHALLHPQPVGSFNQVGYDQMLTLERLSAIFEGSLPLHKSNMTPPPLQVEIYDSDTPPMV